MKNKKANILFIEDDKIDQMAIERFAKEVNFPYDYTIAGSVKEAVDILESNNFDAAVIDYMLGDGTAFDLFNEIEGTPFIIVTSLGDEEIAVKAMKAGASDYLVKDTKGNYLKPLLIIIENAIRFKRAEEEIKMYHNNLINLVNESTKELKKEMNERRLAEQKYRDLKEKLLKERYDILKKANIDSVIVLSQTIEAKDPYTRGHCLRVRDFAKAIGEKYKFDKDKLLFLEFGALLHDIGKIGIPGVILNKKDKLTEEEFSIIKKHPDIGANIIKNVKFYGPIVPMIRYHHVFYNGNGYPKVNGLKKENIPLEARILSVGDAFDAMTTDRPYRKAFSIEKAISILKELSGSQFDPDIVDIFISNKIYKLEHPVTQKMHLEF
ncbi:MAG: HD domain-containing protein [Spirochaetes bacterium]|nr:HD domain-containing protein [Spirochaetota bacterium]